jgi:peptide/nickel transport system permease protein
MLIAVSAISFVLLSNAGGDAFTVLRENPQVSDATIEQLRTSYGLDRPVAVRYVSWLGSFLTGDLGESIHFKVPVAGLVLSRLSYTFALGAAAVAFAWSFALLLGFLSARFNSRALDRAIEFTILITASVPRIALSLFALALIVWSSQTTAAIRQGSVASFVLSSLVLSIPLIALFLAQANDALRSAMEEDFVKLARSKGLSENILIIRHASRAALGPLLTLLGLSIGGIIGGTVIVETILGWPGIGSLTVTSVRVRDVPMVMGIVVISTLVVWLGNAIAEVLQMLNDARLGEDSLS